MFRSTTIANLAKTIPSPARLNLGRALAPVARGYHEKVISHYERPKNVHSDWVYLIILLTDDLSYRSVLSPKTTLTSVQDSLAHLRKS